MENKDEKIIQQNSWAILVKNLNSLNERKIETVRRQEIMSLFQNWHYSIKPQDSTIDIYRRTLTVLGYLEDTNQKGVYKIIKHIPVDLTSSDAKEKSAKEIQISRIIDLVLTPCLKVSLWIPKITFNKKFVVKTDKFGKLDLDTYAAMQHEKIYIEDLKFLYTELSTKYLEKEPDLYSEYQIVNMFLANRLSVGSEFICEDKELLKEHISYEEGIISIHESTIAICENPEKKIKYLIEDHTYKILDGNIIQKVPEPIELRSNYSKNKIYKKIK